MRSGVAAGRGLLIGAELVLGLACKGQSAKGHATTCLAERVYDIAGLRSLAVGGYQLCHRDSVLVMITLSPAATASSRRGRCVFASKAPTDRMSSD